MDFGFHSIDDNLRSDVGSVYHLKATRDYVKALASARGLISGKSNKGYFDNKL